MNDKNFSGPVFFLDAIALGSLGAFAASRFGELKGSACLGAETDFIRDHFLPGEFPAAVGAIMLGVAFTFLAFRKLPERWSLFVRAAVVLVHFVLWGAVIAAAFYMEPTMSICEDFEALGFFNMVSK